MNSDKVLLEKAIKDELENLFLRWTSDSLIEAIGKFFASKQKASLWVHNISHLLKQSLFKKIYDFLLVVVNLKK